MVIHNYTHTHTHTGSVLIVMTSFHLCELGGIGSSFIPDDSRPVTNVRIMTIVAIKMSTKAGAMPPTTSILSTV